MLDRKTIPTIFKKYSKNIIKIVIGCVTCCVLTGTMWIILLIYLTNWAIQKLPSYELVPKQHYEIPTGATL